MQPTNRLEEARKQLEIFLEDHPDLVDAVDRRELMQAHQSLDSVVAEEVDG